MKIDKIQIQNFKSILDSGEVSLDKNITTFIGKNEQGKTNYLKALESFNKDIYYKDDDLCHHLDKTIEDTDIPIVTIWFKLDKNDKINLGDIKEELAQIERLKVTKYYDGRYYFEIDEPQIATTVLDHINNAEENVLDIKSQLIVLSQTVSPNIGLLHRIDCQTHIDSILSCLNADGGFGHLPGQPSNISFTYYAIGVLKELNVLDKLDKEKIIAFSLSTQHQNGGFGHLPGGQPQTQFTHDAIAVLKELDALNRIDYQNVVNFILSCQNADGGFGHLPGQPSQISFTYYAIRALKVLNTLDRVDKEKINAFVLSTQHENGGFGHLPGQQPQIQFTHDAIVVLKELDALSKIDYQNQINFILSCANADGGFGNIPSQQSHILYTDCGVKALNKLKGLNNANKEKIIEFTLSTQNENGGFGHLPREQPQIQFTYDAIIILKEFGQFLESNYEQVIKSFNFTDLHELNEINRAFNVIYDYVEKLLNGNYINRDVLDVGYYFEMFDDLISAEIKNDIKSKILDILPIFVYFDSNLDLLSDNIDVTEYLKNKDKYRTFTDLFQLAGLDIEGINGKDHHHRRLHTDKASATITGMVNDSWNQDKVTINVGIDGANIFTFIQDEVGAHVPPSKRSDGFQWYLSFYINFMASTKGALKNAILLIDNSGLLLHPSGQKDLLNVLEKLATDNQIIFTTHSPYLIDRSKLDGIRIVKKDKESGSILVEKFHVTDFDALEPIRSAFGISIGDSLFGSKQNLIVEGFSDCLILEGMARYLKMKGYASIDFSKISIIPVGGAKKVPYFALLVWKEGYKFVALLDNDKEGRKVAKDLANKYPINKNQIITLGDANKNMNGEDIAIEDLIEPSFYNKVVNETYKELLMDKIGSEEIKMSELRDSIHMQDKQYSAYFKEKKLGTFDKIQVAKELSKIVLDSSLNDEIIGEDTINSFEKLFEIINQRLK